VIVSPRARGLARACDRVVRSSPVLGHLNCHVHEFKTTQPSKVRIIENVALCLENQTLKFSHAACSKLASELRGYQEPDDYVETDTVMSLAIGLDSLGLAFSMGTLLAPFHA
jgi:hypothetical protein